MASCFEVTMALIDDGFVRGEDMDAVTTILVETLLATGTIKERSKAVEDKTADEEMYTAAEYAAAADEAMGDFEAEIEQAEIMLEAKDRQISHEQIIMDADEVISENARLATASLAEKDLVNSDVSDQVQALITKSWSSENR